MKAAMRAVHRWIGLVIGLQFVLWMASGAVMSVLDAESVHGQTYRIRPAPPAHAWPAQALPPGAALASAGMQVESVSNAWLLERPVYRLAGGGRTWLVDARNAAPVAVDAATAARIAAASYNGPGQPARPVYLEASPETRKHKGAVWRIDFADDIDTSVYVSAATGNVLEHRNRVWRLFDFFWMLHIMDYAERTSFNHPLVIGVACAALVLSLSGTWLLLAAMRLKRRRAH